MEINLNQEFLTNQLIGGDRTRRIIVPDSLSLNVPAGAGNTVEVPFLQTLDYDNYESLYSKDNYLESERSLLPFEGSIQLSNSGAGPKPSSSSYVLPDYMTSRSGQYGFEVVDGAPGNNKVTSEVGIFKTGTDICYQVRTNTVQAPTHSSNWCVSWLPRGLRRPRLIFNQPNYKTQDSWWSTAQSYRTALQMSEAGSPHVLSEHVRLMPVSVNIGDATVSYVAFQFLLDQSQNTWCYPMMTIAYGQRSVTTAANITSFCVIPLAANVSLLPEDITHRTEHVTAFTTSKILDITIINGTYHCADRHLFETNSAGCVRPRFCVLTARDGVRNHPIDQNYPLRVTQLQQTITVHRTEHQVSPKISNVSEGAILDIGTVVSPQQIAEYLDFHLDIRSAHPLSAEGKIIKAGLTKGGSLLVDSSVDGSGYGGGGHVRVPSFTILGKQYHKSVLLTKGTNVKALGTLKRTTKGSDVLTYTERNNVFVKSLGHRLQILPSFPESYAVKRIGYVNWVDHSWVISSEGSDKCLQILVSEDNGSLYLLGHALYSEILAQAALYILSEAKIAAFIDRYSFSNLFTTTMLNSIQNLDPLHLHISDDEIRAGLMVDMSHSVFGELFRYRNLLYNRYAEDRLLSRGFIGKSFKLSSSLIKRNGYDGRFLIGDYCLLNSERDRLIGDFIKVLSVNAAIIDVDVKSRERHINVTFGDLIVERREIQSESPGTAM